MTEFLCVALEFARFVGYLKGPEGLELVVARRYGAAKLNEKAD
ncbi:hypothetical protein [Brevirhabdus sp.]